MRKTACPHCRAVLTLDIPPDAPVAAQIPYLCADCGQSFLYTVGHGLPLLLARVRLWIDSLPSTLLLALFAGFVFAGWRLWLWGGYTPVLIVLGLLVMCGLCHQRALNDVFSLVLLVVGTATLTALAAFHFGNIGTMADCLPMMGMTVLLALVLAYFGAPPDPWQPPPLGSNTQHGNTRVLVSEQDIEGTGL